MKNALVILGLILIIASMSFVSGCARDPQAQAPSSNVHVPVDKLLETDGCVVYRFYDAGHYHYFAKCASASSTGTMSIVPEGKSSYVEEIQTHDT